MNKIFIHTYYSLVGGIVVCRIYEYHEMVNVSCQASLLHEEVTSDIVIENLHIEDIFMQTGSKLKHTITFKNCYVGYGDQYDKVLYDNCLVIMGQ